MKYIFAYAYPFVLAQFEEKSVPSSLNCLYIFIKTLVVHIRLGLLGLDRLFSPTDPYFLTFCQCKAVLIPVISLEIRKI